MTRHPLYWLPNVLTLSRFVMGSFVAWVIIHIAQHEASLYTATYIPAEADTAHKMASTSFRQNWGAIGLIVFVFASITDWLDGYLARKWHATSRLGRLLDPIADKFVVGIPLIAIAWAVGWTLPITLPVAIIVLRDVFITTMRFAGLGANAMAVSQVAKFKTFLELLVVALFIAAMALLGPAGPVTQALLTSWLFALWGVSLLSAWTGLAYLLRLFASKPPEQTPPAN